MSTISLLVPDRDVLIYAQLQSLVTMQRYLHPLLCTVMAALSYGGAVLAQNPNTRLVIRAQNQEVNIRTGVITVRGNVKMEYPARQIQASATQGQYFTKEKKIVLTGDVIVLQFGNSIKAETITYLIEEGKFEAAPKNNQQVESIYIVDDPDAAANPTARTSSVKEIKPVFKQFNSPTIEIEKKNP